MESGLGVWTQLQRGPSLDPVSSRDDTRKGTQVSLGRLSCFSHVGQFLWDTELHVIKRNNFLREKVILETLYSISHRNSFFISLSLMALTTRRTADASQIQGGTPLRAQPGRAGAWWLCPTRGC